MHFGENQLSPSLIGLSRRASWHRVLLAFHPYPQLIPQVFNPGGFGPPRGLTRASTWPWVDHSASGLEHATNDTEVPSALFGLAFATATPHGLTSPRTANSQAHSSKGTQSPRHPKALQGSHGL